MKSTERLMRENNVKSLRLNNTDRETFENYMTYVRADLSVNPYDSEKMLNRILAQLLQAEKEGTLAMDFFDHDPKSHAKNEIKNCQMKRSSTYSNIFSNTFYFSLVFFVSLKDLLVFLSALNDYIYIHFL